jgi:hypothetical protein
VKRLSALFAVLCLVSCSDLPVADNRLELSARPTNAEEILPEAQARIEPADITDSIDIADETDETARGLHGLVKTETDEPEISRPLEPGPESLSGLSEPPDPVEPPPVTPPPAPAAREPPVSVEPPVTPARPVPPVPIVQEPPPPVTPPPVPAARELPVPIEPPSPPRPASAVQKPPVPPPVPEFIRPSEPLPPPERESERPVVAIPDLPALPRSLSGSQQNYSRTVNAFAGQYVEIPFRGPGWVYLGELGSRRGVSYNSRRLDSEGMVFVFRADEEGTYSLRFNRQDFIRDFIINDYIKVIVEAAPEITGSVWHSTAVTPDRVYAAPRWPPAGGLQPPLRAEAPLQPEAPSLPTGSTTEPAAPRTAVPTGSAVSTESVPTGNAAGQEGQARDPGPAVQTEQSAAAQGLETALPPGSTPGDYLSRAREEYEAGRIAGALGILDLFSLAYPGGSDEAYWLYAQSMEANGPNRDIRLALDYYRRLVREYPQSGRYDSARRRIAYLERFYFDIR